MKLGRMWLMRRSDARVSCSETVMGRLQFIISVKWEVQLLVKSCKLF